MIVIDSKREKKKLKINWKTKKFINWIKQYLINIKLQRIGPFDTEWMNIKNIRNWSKNKRKFIEY